MAGIFIYVGLSRVLWCIVLWKVGFHFLVTRACFSAGDSIEHPSSMGN